MLESYLLFTVEWLDSNYDERVCRSLLKKNYRMVGDTSKTLGTQKLKSLMKMVNKSGP